MFAPFFVCTAQFRMTWFNIMGTTCFKTEKTDFFLFIFHKSESTKKCTFKMESVKRFLQMGKYRPITSNILARYEVFSARNF